MSFDDENDFDEEGSSDEEQNNQDDQVEDQDEADGDDNDQDDDDEGGDDDDDEGDGEDTEMQDVTQTKLFHLCPFLPHVCKCTSGNEFPTRLKPTAPLTPPSCLIA